MPVSNVNTFHKSDKGIMKFAYHSNPRKVKLMNPGVLSVGFVFADVWQDTNFEWRLNLRWPRGPPTTPSSKYVDFHVSQRVRLPLKLFPQRLNEQSFFASQLLHLYLNFNQSNTCTPNLTKIGVWFQGLLGETDWHDEQSWKPYLLLKTT